MTEESKNIFIVAIDGFSSCGKSTLAKQLAKQFEFVYVDTGAMYRAATLFFLDNNIDINDINGVSTTLDSLNITFKNIDGQNTTFLNGENVEDKIRDIKVSSYVSEVAAIPAVRKKMVFLQKQMAASPGLIMDGRDIGTVVFPHAHLKLFVTADAKVRAKRRYEELLAKGQSTSLKEVEDNINHRDTIDTQRKDSPLKKADDAILIDNTQLSIDDQFHLAARYIKNRMADNKIN